MCGYNPCDESCGYGSYGNDCESYDYCRPRRNRCHKRYVEVYEYSNCDSYSYCS